MFNFTFHDYFDNQTMDTHEEFICDKCDCAFDIDGKISFDTKVNTLHDFSEDYSTQIYKGDRSSLNEPNEVLW